MQKTTSTVKVIPILILLLVSFAVYFNALFGDFVWDDKYQILDNPWIRDIRNIPTIFSKNVWSFEPSISTSNYFRPLMHIVYMLNYHVFGLKPWGFHLVNILFHSGVSILVFLVIRRFLTEHNVTTSSVYLSPPFIAAMLFASHPIHTEAVTWIAGLPDVAFTFFYLLSFYLYVRSKVVLSGSYLFSVVCFAISAFFKEPALTLPIVLLAHDYLFRKERPHFPDYLKRYVPYLVIGVGYLILRTHALGEFAPVKRYVTASAYQYAINVSPLFAQYLLKLCLPVNLNAFYVLHPVFSIFEPRSIVSLIVTASFLAVAITAFKKNRLLFLSLLLIALPLLPVLYITAVGENAFAERYLYLPSLGFVICFAFLFCKIEAVISRQSITVVLVSMVLIAFSIGTISRSAVWKDNLTLFTDMVRKSPDGEVPNEGLASVLLQRGQIDEAIERYQITLTINQYVIEPYNGLGLAFFRKGLLNEAIEYFQFALKIDPSYLNAHMNLVLAYEKKGQIDKAMEHLKTAMQLSPGNPAIQNLLSRISRKRE